MKRVIALVAMFVGVVMALSSCGVTRMTLRENVYDSLTVAALEPDAGSKDAQTIDNVTVAVTPVSMGGDDFTAIFTSLEEKKSTLVANKEITHEKLVPIISNGGCFPIFMVKIMNNTDHVINIGGGDAAGRGSTVIAFVPDNGNPLFPTGPEGFGTNEQAAKANLKKMPTVDNNPDKEAITGAASEAIPVVGSTIGIFSAKKKLNQLQERQTWMLSQFALQQQQKHAREAFNKKFGGSQVNAGTRVLPGYSAAGYVMFDYNLVNGGNGAEFRIFDLITKVDDSGVPVKKATFSWKYKIVMGKASAIGGFAGPRIQGFKTTPTESAEEQDKAKAGE